MYKFTRLSIFFAALTNMIKLIIYAANKCFVLVNIPISQKYFVLVH